MAEERFLVTGPQAASAPGSCGSLSTKPWTLWGNVRSLTSCSWMGCRYPFVPPTRRGVLAAGLLAPAVTSREPTWSAWRKLRGAGLFCHAVN